VFEEAPMTAAEDESRMRGERAQAVALFRYQLVRELADPGLSTRQRGRLVRDLAGREHMGPFGTPVRVSRQSLDRWILAWRRGGFDALLPAPRQVTARTPAEILDMAAALKRENPDRTAAQVVRILRTHLGWTPSQSTVARLFTRLELAGPATARPSVFGRFEAAAPNDRWTGDALCRMRHNASYGDRRVMPTGPARLRRLVLVATGWCHLFERHKYLSDGERLCLVASTSR
jgi:putative transposase